MSGFRDLFGGYSSKEDAANSTPAPTAENASTEENKPQTTSAMPETHAGAPAQAAQQAPQPAVYTVYGEVNAAHTPHEAVQTAQTTTKPSATTEQADDDEDAGTRRRRRKSRLAYRTISEAADELDVATHVLRFWESKFSILNPAKKAGGRRYYSQDDLRTLKKIKHLLYTEGFTIKGVQAYLKKEQQGLPTATDNGFLVEMLDEVRDIRALLAG